MRPIHPFAPFALTLLAVLSPLATAAAGQAPEEDAADLILRHGVFYPVDPPEPVRGSLAVADGRIAYLGDDAGAERLRGPDTRVVELDGRAVTPGLIDAHSHLEGLGAALEQVDLVGTGSYEEVVAQVAERAAELPEGSWVRGRGWDQNDWPVQEFPHHEPLSRAVPGHPVWITRIDGHAALLNRAAIERLGLDDAVEDPPGGRFLRDEEGRLTGVLIDRAMGIAGAAIPPPSAADLERWILAGAEHAASLGLTTVTDMGVSGATVAAYRDVRDRLPVRAMLFLTDDAPLLAEWFERGPLVDPEARVTVRGVKLYADGALGSRGAALVEPYSDDPGNLGLLTASGEHLEDVSRRALDAGFQAGIHAIGDRGALVTLDAVERAFGGRARAEARFRLEHAQVMRLQDLERMVQLGVIASMQPTHATSDMPWAGNRVGEERLDGAYAWRKVLDAGGRLALGSDFPVESADPRLGLYAAVTRQDLEGDPPGGWLPGERLERDEALAGFTRDAAWSLFLEDEVGRLAPGLRADLVVFAEDPMTVPAERIPHVPVDLTVVGGEIVHERRGEP